MAIDKIYKEFSSEYQKEIRKLEKAIIKYDRIAIFRHAMPDYDALGSQFGLATWLKDNFPNKEIKVFGDNHVTFTPRLFPETDDVNEEWFKEKPSLALILDVSNTSRISDPRWKKCKYKIRIDHHPRVEEFGKVSIINTNGAAAAENIVNCILNFKGKYAITPEAARYFFIGIAGDSGRFMYSSTSKHTFAIAGLLIETGFNLSKTYQAMYQKEVDDLYVTAYVLNNFHISEKGVAWYVLDQETQDRLKITSERGKENVNVFANINGVNAWCSITEDSNPKDYCWRVSIRSKEKAINGVAAMFEGGGHAQASGARLNSLDDLPRLIEELGKLF